MPAEDLRKLIYGVPSRPPLYRGKEDKIQFLGWSPSSRVEDISLHLLMRQLTIRWPDDLVAQYMDVLSICIIKN